MSSIASPRVAEYRRIALELKGARIAFGAQLTEEQEDSYLDRLDAIWREMTSEEVDELEKGAP